MNDVDPYPRIFPSPAEVKVRGEALRVIWEREQLAAMETEFDEKEDR
jgi:hypothetical protein